MDETVSNYGNGTWEVDFPLINTEYYCTVLIEIRDHYDYSDEKTRTKAECNFESKCMVYNCVCVIRMYVCMYAQLCIHTYIITVYIL